MIALHEKEYNDFQKGSTNVAIQNEFNSQDKTRNFYFRWFLGTFTTSDIKKKFRFQAYKKLSDTESKAPIGDIVREFCKKYEGSFGK